MTACLTLRRHPSGLVAWLAAWLTLLPLGVHAQTVPDWTSVQAGATGAALTVDAAGQTLAMRFTHPGELSGLCLVSPEGEFVIKVTE